MASRLYCNLHAECLDHFANRSKFGIHIPAERSVKTFSAYAGLFGDKSDAPVSSEITDSRDEIGRMATLKSVI